MSRLTSPASRNNGLDRFVQQLEAGFLERDTECSDDDEVIGAEEADQRLADEALRLRELQRLLVPSHHLVPGDLVRWKPGMKNRSLPGETQLAVVTEVLTQPVFDTSADGLSAGSSIFREPLDVKLGVVVRSGDFVEYHYDSRRFETVVPQRP